MPIFSYECGKCHYKFDELVLGSEKIACPKCGSQRLKKRLAPFAVGAGSSSESNPCDSGSCDMDSCPTGSCCSGGDDDLD